MQLLSYYNAKTVKGEKIGVKTAILYLSPGSMSGTNLCIFASDGCLCACLNTAGHGAFSNVQQARLNKTKLFLSDRKFFVDLLKKDINAHIRKSEKEKLLPAVRLNGTSDVTWEKEPGNDGKILMESFPSINFYDYTKHPARALQWGKGTLPPNYHLTFSRSESNEKWVTSLLGKVNIAMVFDTKKGKSLPTTYRGVKVVDGDETDVRFKDEKNVIVGLRSKGRGKKDTTGFVISTKDII